MRIQINILLTIVLFSGTILFGQQSSVVIIDTESSNGYGVAWGGPDLVVTALHVVAGREKIMVRWGSKKSMATVEKIYKPADLALLRLDSKLGIPQLASYPGDPSFGVNLNYWEAPAGQAPRPISKTTKLDERTPLKDINAILAKKNAAFDKGLCKDDQNQLFPQLETVVFKFAEPNIRKSHSGTPITIKDKLVGLVDGGSGLVAGKTMVWAIPATELEKLLKQGAAPPPALAGCESKALYSGLRSDNPFLSDELRERAIELENAPPITTKDDTGDELVFSLEFRGSYQDVFYSMLEEDQQFFLELIEGEQEEDNPVTMSALYQENCDILVEENTGATIAYPSGINWETYSSSSHNFIKIDSPHGGVSMYIAVSRTGSTEESKAELEAFKAFLTSDGRNWVAVDEDDAETFDFLDDEDDPMYYEDFWREVRSSTDDDYDVLAELYASMEIDESNFLGVAVIVNDWETVYADPEERKFYYLMEACAMLTGFGYY